MSSSLLQKGLNTLLENLSQGKLEILCEPADSPPPVTAENPNAPTPRALYQPHRHHYCEVVQSIGGKNAKLLLDDGPYTLRTDRAVLIGPQVNHVERPVRKDRPYDLLWGVLNPTMSNFFSSCYRHRNGYLDTQRLTVIGQSGIDLPAALHGPAPLGHSRCQAMLLQIAALAMEQCSHPTQQPHHATDRLIEQVRSYIDDHLTENLSLNELSAMVRLSPNHLNTLFRGQSDLPIRQYIIRQRLARAAELIKKSDLQIKQIAYRVGFRDPL